MTNKSSWFAILDVTRQDFEKRVNVTFDTEDNAIALTNSYMRDYPERKFKLFKEVSN